MLIILPSFADNREPSVRPVSSMETKFLFSHTWNFLSVEPRVLNSPFSDFETFTQMAKSPPMALDFFIGSDTSRYQTAGYSFSLSESSHTQLFTFLEHQPDSLRNVPLLARMQNFYTDCRYEAVELPPLGSELIYVLHHLNSRTPLFLTVQEFHTFSQRALALSEPIFGCCD